MPEWKKAKRALDERLLSKVTKTKTCWLWGGGTNGRGYGVIGISEDGRRQSRYVHRLSFELFKGPVGEGMEVAHLCDVRNCVNPEHLTLMTHRQNEDDKKTKGRVPRGETQWRAKLTEDGVRTIRRRAADGEPFNVLAAEFGVTRSNIEHVVARRRWAHVD